MNGEVIIRIVIQTVLAGMLVISFTACGHGGGLPKASAAVDQLEPGNTYEDYDVDGDGENDTIELEQVKEYQADGLQESQIDIYINGEKEIEAKGCKGCTVFAFTQGEQCILFNEFLCGDGGKEWYQHPYKNGQYHSEEVENIGCFREEVSAEDDKLLLKGTPKGAWWLRSFENFEQMPFAFNRYYDLEQGRLKAVSDYSIPSGKTKFTALSAFSTGKELSDISAADGPAVSAGQKVTLTAISYDPKTGSYYYQIKTDGKKGWFEDSEDIRFEAD